MGTRAEQAFVGEDRRRAPRHLQSWYVLVGGAAAVVLTAAVVRPAWFGTRSDALRWVFHTAAVLTALGLFSLCRAHWRLSGETRPLWAGTAALVVGVAVVAGPAIVGPLVLDRPPAPASALRGSGLLVALVLLAGGARAAAVDTRLRAYRLVVAAGTATIVVAAAIEVVPVLGEPLVVAAGCALVGVLGRRQLGGWAGLLLLGMAVAQVTDGVTQAAVEAVAMSAALVGCALLLGRTYTDQRSRLFRSEVTVEAAAVQERLRSASQRIRRHDVRNAVVAVEGAAVTLERHIDRLSDEDRAMLSQVLSSGVERIQRLLGDEARSDETVDLAGVAQAVGADPEWDGRVVIDVPPLPPAAGSTLQTSEVLRVLLHNASRRAPGQPVVVQGRRDGGWLVLQVRDRGPAVSRQRRRSLDHDGDMGFLVAGRLMRDQGGDLWVESHPDGGAFSLCLPAADANG